jgi:hypothetical protein
MDGKTLGIEDVLLMGCTAHCIERAAMHIE